MFGKNKYIYSLTLKYIRIKKSFNTNHTLIIMALIFLRIKKVT